MPFSAKTGFFGQQVVLDYPNWPVQANTSQFNTEVALYSGTPGTASISIAGNPQFTPTPGLPQFMRKYRGGALAPNGNVYLFPQGLVEICEIDPTANANTDFSVGIGGDNRYGPGALGKNGNIYLPPLDEYDVIEFSPSLKTVRDIPAAVTNVDNWIDAVADKSGNVICLPYINQDEFINIDCSTEPVTLSKTRFGVPASELGSNKYLTGSVHPNGNIYLSPFNSDSFLEVDVVNESYTKYDTGEGTGNTLCIGTITGADGNIYGVPYNANTVLMLNPTTGVVSDFLTHGKGDEAYRGGTAAPNGNIYMAPYDADEILEIDPLAGTSSFLTLPPNKYSNGSSEQDTIIGGFSGAVSDTANVYLVPSNAGNTVVIPLNATGGTNSKAYTLSSYVNSGH